MLLDSSAKITDALPSFTPEQDQSIGFPDAFPAEEDPVPFDGEPHPEHAPIVLGANHLQPNCQNELQGAAANLGFFGGNPHPNPAHLGHQQVIQEQQNPIVNQQQPIQEPDDMEEDEEDNGWPAWNPAVFAADNGQDVPHHPVNPHDCLDLELSGSSMRFLRGDGPEISLDQLIQAGADTDISSSSDASSELIQERARFEAVSSRCANILIFGRKGLPGDVFMRATNPVGRNSGALGTPIIIPAPIISAQGWRLFLGSQFVM